MAVGPRQRMIGNTPKGGEQQSAQPGPDFTGQVDRAKRAAENAGRRLHAAARLQTPRGGADGRERP